MKYIQLPTVVIATILLFTSCTKYLDIVPDNVATLENAFTMRNTAESYLFTCYSYLPKHGDLTPDAASLSGGDLWPLYTVTTNGARLARGEQNVVNPLLNYWSGRNSGTSLYQGIRDCNIFL